MAIDDVANMQNGVRVGVVLFKKAFANFLYRTNHLHRLQRN
jgi:hypothetical protein